MTLVAVKNLSISISAEERETMKNLYILFFSTLAVLIILSLFYYLDLFLYIALWLGISLILVMGIIVALFTIVFLLAIPYYLITKKKEVEEYGNYRLKDVEGKE